MPGINCFQVDAFTSRPFSGNPAAVCLLHVPSEPGWMQAVAAEMNLSETAFVRRTGDQFELRWFTPAVEVDLCGHATLAAAHVLWEEQVAAPDERIEFTTRSGLLTAAQNNGRIELDFPSTPPVECHPTSGLLESLGVQANYVGKTRFDYLVALDDESYLRELRPDFRRLSEVAARGIIVTSRSGDPRFHFVSRFFAPASGIDEDPVTGSAHCALAPFWQARLGISALTGYQASSRGGTVRVRNLDDRVLLGGEAVTVWRGQLTEQAAQ